uniref:Uncharacterized protein n=1 Tax=viral metagenome TaxID=1070528 RepID=A0A6M3KYZ3_9ZZZZ
MERTLREFLDKLKENGGWDELAGKGTITETRDYVLRKTVESVLIGDEIARIQGKIAELEMERAKIINEHPEIRALTQKIHDKTTQMKSLGVMLDSTIGQVYMIIGAKLGDLRERLELPKPEKPEEGVEFG